MDPNTEKWMRPWQLAAHRRELKRKRRDERVDENADGNVVEPAAKKAKAKPKAVSKRVAVDCIAPLIIPLANSVKVVLVTRPLLPPGEYKMYSKLVAAEKVVAIHILDAYMADGLSKNKAIARIRNMYPMFSTVCKASLDDWRKRHFDADGREINNVGNGNRKGAGRPAIINDELREECKLVVRFGFMFRAALQLPRRKRAARALDMFCLSSTQPRRSVRVFVIPDVNDEHCDALIQCR
jgi:hypothetical protein